MVSPAARARASVPSNCARPRVLALDTTWNMFWKPRPVTWSENDMVSSGMPRRSATSDTARVSEEANAPRMAATLFCAISRCATVPAVVGVEVLSATTRFTLAPPSAAMPPAALISSATSSIPLREFTPNCALGPDNGRMTPTFTARAWARSMVGAAISPAAG